MVKTLIFDLGGVVIDLDVAASIEALAKIIGVTKDEVSALYYANDFFRSYEKGLIPDEEFRDKIRAEAKNPISDLEVDLAWNAMLIGISPKRMELIQKLGKNHQMMVLSNTNAIHVRCFNQILEDVTGKDDLKYFFDVVYFSHLMKMRKPDPEIFEFVLAENDLNPQEALFLDDNKENLGAAEKLGIRTQHVDHPDRLFDICKEWI